MEGEEIRKRKENKNWEKAIERKGQVRESQLQVYIPSMSFVKSVGKSQLE